MQNDPRERHSCSMILLGNSGSNSQKLDQFNSRSGEAPDSLMVYQFWKHLRFNVLVLVGALSSVTMVVGWNFWRRAETAYR